MIEDQDSLTAEEKAKAEKYGLLKPDDESQEEKESDDSEEVEENEENEESSDDSQESQESEDADDSEDVLDESREQKLEESLNNNDPDISKKFTKNEIALYVKQKEERRKRQEAQEELDAFRKKYSEDLARSKSYEEKLARLKAVLKKEDLTVEELQGILGDDVVRDTSSEKPLTRADLEEIEREKQLKNEQLQRSQEKLSKKLVDVRTVGLSLDDNFVEYAKMADEMAKRSPVYDELFSNKLNNPNADLSDIAKTVIDIARLHPNFNKVGQSTEVDRALKNASKKKSSASISAGGGKVKNYENLTAEGLLNLPPKEYRKVPKKIKERLLSAV